MYSIWKYLSQHCMPRLKKNCLICADSELFLCRRSWAATNLQYADNWLLNAVPPSGKKTFTEDSSNTTFPTLSSATFILFHHIGKRAWLSLEWSKNTFFPPRVSKIKHKIWAWWPLSRHLLCKTLCKYTWTNVWLAYCLVYFCVLNKSALAWFSHTEVVY